MRKTLTSFVALAAVLALSACGDPEPKPSPKTYKPGEVSTVMPDDAPPQEEAGGDDEASPAASGAETASACAATLGSARAAALVRRCIAVSPATHPPCNVQNDCATIQGEIDRSCAMYGPDEARPAECAG